MRCSLCLDRSITRDPRFCEYHFNRYVKKKVSRVLGKILGLDEKRILIAVSGGKDSMALAHILKDFPFYKELFYIDLGIPEYSDKGKQIVSEFASKFDMKLNIYNLSDLEFTIKDASCSNVRASTCSICGTVKRYISNKFAYEHDFDYVATGHNFTDMAAMSFLNISTGNLQYTSRLSSVQHPNKNLHLVGTVKPFFHVPERHTLIYALLHKLPFYSDECPYSTNNTQIKAKHALIQINKDFPSFSHNLLKFGRKWRTAEIKVHLCECGYPTTTQTCRFCRLSEKLRNSNRP